MSKKNFRVRGYITVEELKSLGLIPEQNRLMKGPVAIAECPEQIPCDICVHSCPLNAITMSSINDIPRIDWNRCVGCALCVPECPGLAIFVVGYSRDGSKGLVTLPYEFNPKPKVGDVVDLLSRDGRIVGKGKVVRVWRKNLTWVVTVEVPKDKVFEVRAIWIRRE